MAINCSSEFGAGRREEIDILLKEEGASAGALVAFEGTDGQVELAADDYVHIRSAAEMFVATGDDGPMPRDRGGRRK